MNLQNLATEFLNAYYNTMMTDRSQMVNYYRENSQMSYEGDAKSGLKQINDKFVGLSFKSIAYQFEGMDFQPTIIPNTLIIAVNGTLNMDNENTFNFFETFLVTQDNNGNFYVANDLFKLIMN